MSKKKEERDKIVSLQTPFGLLDQIPGIAPFDYTTPSVTNTQITDDPLAQYEVNRVYNNQRYAINFSTTFRAFTLTPFVEVDESDESFEENNGIINYISSFFGLISGYCHVRIPTIHDGVLPIPDVSKIGTRDYDIVAAMYPKAYLLNVTELNVPRSSIIEVQALDVNRNNYNIIKIIEASPDSPATGDTGDTAPRPVGPPSPRPGDSDIPPVTSGEPCNDNGNYGATRGKAMDAAYHTMLDFVPQAILPLRDEFAGNKITSVSCERTAPVAGASTNHQGTDIAAEVGTPVYSPARGKVVRLSSSDPKNPENDAIVIWHPRAINQDKNHDEVKGKKLYTRYFHLDTRTVSLGDEVGIGQQIGTSGNKGVGSGPHLHYEMRWGTGPTAAQLGKVITAFRAEKDKDIPPEAAEYRQRQR